MYRIDLHNSVPYLGNFLFSPMYLLVQKNSQGDGIGNIKCITGRNQELVLDIEKGLDHTVGLSDRIRLDGQAQLNAWFTGACFKDDFDVDSPEKEAEKEKQDKSKAS